MTLKVALSAGHGYHTPGKRTPDGEREWSFNDKVTRALLERLLQYEGVEVLRLDDPTGQVDVSMTERSNKANAWGADIYVANHHNAYQGRWGTHTGTESFTYNGDWGGKKANNPKELELAKALNDAIVAAYGLRNRGLKKENFHEVREPKMLAVLTEGGYMDSSIDIKIMRDDNKLRQSGINQADAIAKIYGLKLKSTLNANKPASEPISKSIEELAKEVIAGKHGTGEAKKKRLGAQYAAVQKRVDEILKPKVKKTYLQLAAHESRWRIYRLGVNPVAGNEIGFLNPKQYGGLEYEILGYENNGNTAIIQTSMFGKVKIFIKDPSAKIVTK